MNGLDPIAVFLAFVFLISLGTLLRSLVVVAHRRRRAIASRPRALAGVAVLAIALVAGGLFASRIMPTGKPVAWGFMNQIVLQREPLKVGHGFDLTTAQTTTVVPVWPVWWPACHPFDQDLGNGTAAGSWLTPDITYTPWAVTITMRISAAYDKNPECGRGFYDFWGTPILVQLREPLAGRPLFDGSAFPPAARPYP